MLITGGSRGIGAATAELAARRGWRVAVISSSHDSEPAARVIERCRAAGAPDAVALRADVSIEAEVVAAFAALDARWGGLDCLVNNAGIGPGYGPFEQLTVADMERTWAVNLTGAFVCAREAVTLMTRDDGGSIVNIGSKAGVIGGSHEWIHYAASKGAIDTLTAGLAKEFAGRGVRVNCVRVGLVAGGFGPWAPEGRVERMSSGIPMLRAGEPVEVAAAILWLASPEAAYVTGTFLDVTGGR